MGSVQAQLYFLCMLLTAVVTGCSQQPEKITSPEVHPDGTVTFRLKAPYARAVQVSGDFSRQPLSMVKNYRGVWTATTGPLKPNLYGYSFSVDHARFTDPLNNFIRVGARSYENQVEVPGEETEFMAVRNVPHGALHEHWYQSAELGTRRIFVYTPPEYDASAGKSYPVLYLLHGMGDEESYWTQCGRANFIMDNLLADGKIKPAIIVMPFGHASRSLEQLPSGSNKKDEDLPRGGPRFGVVMLETDLFSNIIPLMEREYRVSKDRNQHAIAGVSMGGFQALSIGLNNMQYFAYVAGFSSSQVIKNFQADFKTLLADPDKSNEQLKLLWIGCGTEDKLFAGNEKFDELLTNKGVKHQWVTTKDYGHGWPLWRGYLRDLLPKLFEE